MPSKCTFANQKVYNRIKLIWIVEFYDLHSMLQNSRSKYFVTGKIKKKNVPPWKKQVSQTDWRKSKLRNEYCKHDYRILEFLTHNARSLTRVDRFRSTLRVSFSKLPKSIPAHRSVVLRTNRTLCVTPL